MRRIIKDPVTVNFWVSSELRERAKSLNLNVSEICREALEKEVSTLEAKESAEDWDCQP